MLLRRLKKSKSLRIVNLLGLAVIFSCLLISYSFIKEELSYDRFHENAERIVRFAIQYDGEPVDGRTYGFSNDDPIFTGISSIEDVVFLNKINTSMLTYNGTPRIINDCYLATPNFFDMFSFKLIDGDKQTALDAPDKAVISRRLARELFGDESAIGKEINMSGRKFFSASGVIFIHGVFDDFPENSHFHTDLIMHRPYTNTESLDYVYLLLHEQTNRDELAQTISTEINKRLNGEYNAEAYIMPLTDIHLHGRVLRELERNGNISYIYIVAGANILLLIIVLFNLWLNSGLIFSFNRKYYQLLRLNGAPGFVVLRDETLLSLCIGGLAVLLGGLASYLIFSRLDSFSVITTAEAITISLLFLTIVLIVSVLPVVIKLSTTLFLNVQNDLKPENFSLAKVKYMLIAQYWIVMFIVILSFGISRQINLIRTTQVGAQDRSILVMDEQPDAVKERYEVLTEELLKYPEIGSVTTTMQLPGSAIRDMLQVWVEGESASDAKTIPILLVGNDFFPFFDIKPIAGSVFTPSTRSLSDETKMMINHFEGETKDNSITEEYLINRKALPLLGFQSPDEAIGKLLHIDHGAIGYINKGRIVGVTDDFNYTTAYEDRIPQIIIQRKAFQHCVMVRLSPENREQALATFNKVWKEVYPDYPADYTFLQDVYTDVYRNEINAQALVRVFSLLCLVISNLGLIIIMAFVIRRKTKEIGIRKVNGATPSNIIRMLNNRFVVWIGFAFLIAIPGAYIVINRWLETFALKAQVDWYIYAFAGLLVLSISVIAVSWQSWKAAMLNPVQTLKTE